MLEDANSELAKLNREQAAAAAAASTSRWRTSGWRAWLGPRRMRQEFLADVSHDLRTPITSIITAGTAALEDQGLLPETRQSLNGIAEAWRLNRLVSTCWTWPR